MDSQTRLVNDDDRWFLVYFIMGNYFGPDVKYETIKKPILQRVIQGLPPYTLDQLTNSFMKFMEMERLYYYILRNSHKSLTLNLTSLRGYFRGQGQCGNDNYPQFPELFPPDLHPQSLNRHKIVHNVVFINNPDSSYMRAEDIERFKRLSGVEELHVDRNDALQLHTCSDASDVNVESCSGDGAAFGGGGTTVMCDYMACEDEGDADKVGPAMVFLPSRPTEKELSDIVAATKNGFAVTGSVAMGQAGPIIGLLDIGECEDSYLFRISLPGVKREKKEFICEIDNDGKVYICGVTSTGETTVSRYSQVFEMQTHNLCPPGKFSIDFQLPGPVDPHRFAGNFATDGIFDGIVTKRNNVCT